MDRYLVVGWLSASVRVKVRFENKLENHPHLEDILIPWE